MEPNLPKGNSTAALPFLQGGGAMGALIRAFDWGATPLGPAQEWPQSLRTSLSNLLYARFPMLLFWGPELIQFYNDAYRPSLGDAGKHPKALGQRARECWKDVWPTIGPLIAQVIQKGETVFFEDLLVPIQRNGGVEDVYWTFSYSPVLDEAGAIAGLLVVCVETTHHVVNLQRLRQREEELQLAVEATELGVWDIDPVTETFGGNARLREWFGFGDKEKVPVATGISAVKKEDQAAVSAAIQAALNSADDGKYDIEHGVVNPHTGVERVIRSKGRAWFGEDGRLLRFTGTGQDITAHKKAGQKIAAAQRQLETTLSNIPNGILLFEADGQLSFSNEAALADLRSALEGEPMPASYSETMALVLEKAAHLDEQGNPLKPEHSILQKALKTGCRHELLYQRVMKQSGARRWLLSHAIPLIDETGAVARVLVANADITDQKEAALKLAASRQQLEQTLNNIPSAIYLFEEDGGISFANKAALDEMCDLLEGHAHPDTLQELVAAVMEIVDVSTEAGRPISVAESPSQLVFSTGRETEQLFRRRHRDRSDARWVVNRALPLFDDAGKVTRVLAINTDITVQREAAERIRESEIRFRIMADATPNMIWALHPDGSTRYINQYGMEFFGPAVAADGPVKPEVVLHPDEMATVLQTLADAMQQLKPYSIEHKLRRHDGAYRIFLVNGAPSFYPNGELFGYVGSSIDITHVREAEAAMRESEARFRSLAETLPQMVWVTNSDGSVQEFISGKWQEYFGPVSSSEAWTNRSVPEERDAANAAFAAGIAAGQGYQAEIRLKNKDGQYRWHKTVGVPVKDASGRVLKWVGSVIDIHDQKTLAEQLEQQVAGRTRELMRSNEDLQQFAHVASHDLKEPVRKVITFARMLDSIDGAALSDRGRMSLEKVLSASGRMMNMVNGVLAYSKLSSEEQLEERIDLNELVKNVETDLELVFQQKGGMLQTGVLPPVIGAPVLIHQLFYNLVNNALKFSRDGVPPRISISCEMKAEGQVQIVLADNGIGFEPEYAEAIFKTFYRLNSKDKYEGTGLGLSLCRKIVERHGGTITAEGRIGEGATFSITLPAAPDR